MRAYDRILSALGLVGFASFGDAPDPDAAALAVRVLNAMLGEWSVKGYYNPRQFVGTFTSVGSPSISLGAGGDITTNPVEIRAVQVELGASVWPIRMRALEEYHRLFAKTTRGIPQMCAWDEQTPVSAIWFWPVPMVGYTIRVIGFDSIAQITNAQDTINLPDWYAEAIDYNLAKRLLPHLPGLVDPNLLPMLHEVAGSSLSAIKSRNRGMRDVQMVSDFDGHGGGEYMTWAGRVV